jgi:hypothetical protein
MLIFVCSAEVQNCGQRHFVLEGGDILVALAIAVNAAWSVFRLQVENIGSRYAGYM